LFAKLAISSFIAMLAAVIALHRVVLILRLKAGFLIVVSIRIIRILFGLGLIKLFL
jgi:hypothetical protein